MHSIYKQHANEITCTPRQVKFVNHVHEMFSWEVYLFSLWSSAKTVKDIASIFQYVIQQYVRSSHNQFDANIFISFAVGDIFCKYFLHEE